MKKCKFVDLITKALNVNKKQAKLYFTIIIALAIFIGIVWFFPNNDGIINSTIRLLTSITLFLLAITANLINGEERLKQDISNGGKIFITLFTVISLGYLYYSNPKKDIGFCLAILESMSDLFFTIAVFLMGNLINFINPKKDE